MNKSTLAISIIGALIGVLVFTGTVYAQRISVDDLRIQIQDLLVRITELQRQLTEKQGTISWCHTFKENLRYGDSDTEVRALQTALSRLGFYKNTLNGKFDGSTMIAVFKFQELYKKDILEPQNVIRGTGFVGKRSIARLNELYGCKKAEKGQLSVSLDSSSPAGQLLTGGQNGAELAKFRLTASQAEDLDINSIRIEDLGAGDAIDKLNFYVSGKLVGSAVVMTRTAQVVFGDSLVIVPKNSSAVVEIRGNIGKVDSITIQNKDKIQVSISEIKATGLRSAGSIKFTGAVNAASHKVYQSFPEVAFVSGWTERDANKALIPSSSSLLSRIGIAANGPDKISLNTIVIQADAMINDNTVSEADWILKDSNGITLAVNSNNIDHSGTKEFAFNLSTKLNVPAGSTEYINIYGDTTDLEDNGDRIQLWLDDAVADIAWTIGDDSAIYNEGDKIFRGDPRGVTFINSSSPVKIDILSPSAGQKLIKEDVYDIRWKAENVEKLTIELYKNNAKISTITSDLSNSGNYSWEVPKDLVDDSDYTIRIWDTRYPNEYTESEQFTISSKYFNHALTQGWNMITHYEWPPVAITFDKLLSKPEDISQICRWNYDRQEQDCFTKDDAGIRNEIFAPMLGYFALAERDTNFSYPYDKIVTTPSYNLRIGKNWIGISHASIIDDYTAYSFLEEVEEAVQITKFDSSTQSWVSAIRIDKETIIGTDFTLVPGESYQVQVSSDVVWRPSTSLYPAP